MTNKDYTHLSLVVDRSGSMVTIAKDMEGGIKTFLEEQAKLPGTLKVDITTFDTVIERPYVNAQVSDIDGTIIVPRGGTALLDAIGSTIASLGESFSQLPESKRPGTVLVVVVTDGYENSSREWTAEQIKSAIKTQERDYNWKFVFLGANMDAVSVGAQFGFSAGSSMSYNATAGGTQSMLRSMNTYATASRLTTEDVSFSDEDRESALQQ